MPILNACASTGYAERAEILNKVSISLKYSDLWRHWVSSLFKGHCKQKEITHAGKNFLLLTGKKTA